MKLKPVLAAGVCGALVLCAAALGEGDSLISRSDLEASFIPQTVQQGESLQENRLLEAYDQALQRAQQIAGSATPAGSYSADLSPRSLSAGSAVTLETGGCFLLASGAGTVRHDGAVVDATTGTEVLSGGSLTAGHRYLVAEDTRAEFALSAASSAGFSGPYRLDLNGGNPGTDPQPPPGRSPSPMCGKRTGSTAPWPTSIKTACSPAWTTRPSAPTRKWTAPCW